MVKMKFRKPHPYFMVGLLVVMVASLPFLSGMIMRGHDTCFHTQRIEFISSELLTGNFPVRIYHEAIQGYGYGASLFYPDIFLYIPAVLYSLGLSLVKSYNLFLMLINAATYFVSYHSFSKIAKSKTVGVIAAAFYTLSTYRLVDMCTRGSIGELLALIFCPLVLYGLTCLKRGEEKKWYVLTIAFTGLLQSHVLSFVMMAGVAFIYVLIHFVHFIKKEHLLALVKAAVLCILMNGWFLFPFLEVILTLDVNASNITESIWNTACSVIQLFDMTILEPIGAELYSPQITGSVSKTPGVLLLVCSLLYLVISLSDEFENPLKKEMKEYFLFGILGVLMTTSLFPWELIIKVPLLKMLIEKFQFLFRFNVIGISFLSVVAGYAVSVLWIKNENKLERVLLICSVIMMSSLFYLNGFAQWAIQLDENLVLEAGFMDDLYLMKDHDIYSVTEPLADYKKVIFKDYERTKASCTFSYKFEESKSGVVVEVPIVYYPGFVAEIDGEKAKTQLSDRGLVSFELPEEKLTGNVHVYYQQSAVCQAGNAVSMVTWIGLIAWFVFQKKKSLVQH